jgi:hypothetical protein
MKRTFYLASFPKSGNTWVNFTIANIFNQLTGRFEEIDFHNIHDINPEIRVGHEEEDRKEPLFKELPQVFTTHSQFKAAFENVILVLRSPWDVMYSYFHYLRGERQKNYSIQELTSHEKYGIQALVAHNQSFLRNGKNLVIITYENMHADPLKEARKIVDFLGLSVADGIIKAAINKGRTREREKIWDPGLSFYPGRKGR